MLLVGKPLLALRITFPNRIGLCQSFKILSARCNSLKPSISVFPLLTRVDKHLKKNSHKKQARSLLPAIVEQYLLFFHRLLPFMSNGGFRSISPPCLHNPLRLQTQSSLISRQNETTIHSRTDEVYDYAYWLFA